MNYFYRVYNDLGYEGAFVIAYFKGDEEVSAIEHAKSIKNPDTRVERCEFGVPVKAIIVWPPQHVGG